MPHPNTGPGGRSNEGPLWPVGNTPTVYDVAAVLAGGADPEAVALAFAEASGRAGYPLSEEDVAALADSFRLLRRLSPDNPD